MRTQKDSLNHGSALNAVLHVLTHIIRNPWGPHWISSLDPARQANTNIPVTLGTGPSAGFAVSIHEYFALSPEP